MERQWFFWRYEARLETCKKNVPENCLLYINQAYLSTVKSGELTMYNHNFIIGQLIPAANQPEDIAAHECQPNEVKLLTCIYDLANGQFKDVRDSLAFSVLRGDMEEVFLSYGFDADKSKVLYAASKKKIPDAFSCTYFNKH